jgi:hypothetical protein
VHTKDSIVRFVVCGSMRGGGSRVNTGRFGHSLGNLVTGAYSGAYGGGVVLPPTFEVSVSFRRCFFCPVVVSNVHQIPSCTFIHHTEIRALSFLISWISLKSSPSEDGGEEGGTRVPPGTVWKCRGWGVVGVAGCGWALGDSCLFFTLYHECLKTV